MISNISLQYLFRVVAVKVGKTPRYRKKNLKECFVHITMLWVISCAESNSEQAHVNTFFLIETFSSELRPYYGIRPEEILARDTCQARPSLTYYITHIYMAVNLIFVLRKVYFVAQFALINHK